MTRKGMGRFGIVMMMMESGTQRGELGRWVRKQGPRLRGVEVRRRKWSPWGWGMKVVRGKQGLRKLGM